MVCKMLLYATMRLCRPSTTVAKIRMNLGKKSITQGRLYCMFYVEISKLVLKTKFLYFKESNDTKLIYLHCLQCRHFIKLSRVDCQENGQSVKIYTWPHHRYYLPLSSCGAQSTCSYLSLGCVGGKDVQKYRYLLLLYRNQQWVAISITFNKSGLICCEQATLLAINLKVHLVEQVIL